MSKKKILFISALDFKEKSIQVIRNTPEAYVKAGWDVHYVVLRDNSKIGNYFYEEEINPEGVTVYREVFPLKTLKNWINNNFLLRIIRVISNFIAVFKLFRMSKKLIKQNQFDVVYGYECHGFTALKMLHFFKIIRNERQIARFQGTTHFNKYLKDKAYFKILFNMQYALYLSSDMCIMTNDGTNGNLTLKNIKSKHTNNLKFWINGVDNIKLPNSEIQNLKTKLNLKNETVFVSISRLHKYKSVDRGILAVAEYVKLSGNRNIKYFIVGDGQEKENLMQLAKDNNLENEIIFTGAIPHPKVKNFLNVADIFISLYDGSNVGNPLLEAIRTNKIIVTLNEEDTSNWIKHKKNGFIFDADKNLYINIARELDKLLSGVYSKEEILNELKILEKEKLWTWEERMQEEVCSVQSLVNKKQYE